MPSGEERFEGVPIISMLLGQAMRQGQQHVLVVSFQSGETILVKLPLDHQGRAHLGGDERQRLGLERSFIDHEGDFNGLLLSNSPGAPAGLPHDVDRVFGLKPANRRPVDEV